MSDDYIELKKCISRSSFINIENLLNQNNEIRDIYENDNSTLGEIGRKLVSIFGSISIVGWYAIGGAILLLMLVTTINLTRKLGVKI